MGRPNEGKPTRVVLDLKPLCRGSDGAHRAKHMARRENSLEMKNHFKPTKEVFILSVIPRKNYSTTWVKTASWTDEFVCQAYS